MEEGGAIMFLFLTLMRQARMDFLVFMNFNSLWITEHPTE